MPTTFNTTDPKPGYVYDSASDTWFPLVGIAPASQVDRWTKTAAGGETSLSGNDDNAVSLSYTSGTEQVYLNGVLLVRGQDYTATNGTTITGLTALAASDVAEVVTFNPSNILTTDSILDTDFAAKGDLISASAASTPIRVPVGTNGQVLKANSATTSGLEWGTVDADIEGVTAGTGISGGGTSGTVTITNSMATAIAAKGDLIVGTGSQTFVSQSVGANGTVLTANSAQADGVEWTSPLPSQTGNAGKFLTTDGSTASWGSAGLNWTWRARSDNNNQVQGLGTNGSNIYVAVCDTGVLLSSTDSGVTWTSRTSQFGSNRIHAAAFGNGIFVVVGANGLISSSTDGITWTARTSGMSTNIINSVEFLNGNFVAVGDGAAGGTGGITTSTDGITWTKRTTPSGMGVSLRHVTYGNGYYVAVGSLTTTAGVYSTNLSTWTVLPTSVNDSLAYATFQNNQFILHRGSEAKAFYTGNNPTTGWATLTTTGLGLIASIGSADDIKNRIAYYDNKYWFTNTNNSNPKLMTSNGGAITGTATGLSRAGTSYNLPIFANTGTTYVSFSSILINSTGGIVVADNNGNIFTSF